MCINHLFSSPLHFVRGILSPDVRFFFFLSMFLVCMLGPCSPKKAPFCKNLFLYHFPSFFSIVIKEQPILFVKKWVQWFVRPVFLQCWRKVKRSYPCFFCLGGELCWKARLTGTSGMAVNFEILVAATLQHACTKVKACKQNSYSEKRKDRTSGLSIPSFLPRPGWYTRPYHFVWRIFLSCAHFRSSKNDFMGTMGNEGSALAAKKICKVWIHCKMINKINQVVPYKMKGPNPAKFSNCMSRFLYDSDSILKSSILLLLQYGKVQVGSLQNGLWNGPRGPSN